MTDTPAQTPHHGRLQRPPGASGYRVETFRDVLTRHGLTMTLIAGLCLITPGAIALLDSTTATFRTDPVNYAIAAGCLLAFFAHWSRRRDYQPLRQSQWVAYLLGISIVEEVAFRLLLPALFEMQLPRLQAHLLSNALFAALHYVTLRWRLVNCIGTFFGAMGLSYLMNQGDLVMVIMAHWVGTFLNTPWPPGTRRLVNRAIP